jgi:hypothetical protein
MKKRKRRRSQKKRRNEEICHPPYLNHPIFFPVGM